MSSLPESSYALAIHTSSPDLGLALSDFRGGDRLQTWSLGRQLANELHACLVDFLAPQGWSDLAFLAVAQGPGGFTGTRIGVVTARTLAQQLQVPLFAVSSLGAIAWCHACANPADAQTAIAVEMAAQRGEVFGAIYQRVGDELVCQLADQIYQPAAWQRVLADWPTPHRLVRAEGELGATATGILAIAHQQWRQGLRPDWSEALPFYGQHPVKDVV